MLFQKLIKKLKGAKEGQIAIEWEFLADDIITTNPAVSSDNSLIAFGTRNGKIYALDPSGNEKWVYAMEKKLGREELFFLEEEKFKQISAEPVIADLDNDGKDEIIVSSEIGSLFALSPGGKLIWDFSAEDAIKSPALVADVNNDKKIEIIFGSNDGFIYALTSKGKLLWKYKAASGIESTPALIKEINQIIFGSNDGAICSVDGKGNLLWEFKAEDKITAQPAVAKLDNENFHIIIGSTDTSLYALNNNGKLVWRYVAGGKIFSKALILDEDDHSKAKILVGSCDDKLHVVSSRGIKIWDYETGFWVVASPVVCDIDNDGKNEIIVASYDGFVYVFNAEADYALDYIPGIASITQQSGHFSDVLIKQPGSFYGKLLWKYNAGSMVTALSSIKNSKNGILVATNTNKLDKLIYKKD